MGRKEQGKRSNRKNALSGIFKGNRKGVLVMKISKYYKPNSIYKDRAGTCYTIIYKPNIRGYHMVRLQSDGEKISNSGCVFTRWIRELQLVV
jgi:hypothetical protein